MTAVSEITDVHVSFGFWPFADFPHRTLGDLTEHLRRHGIPRAWVSAIETVLYPDPDVHDERLFTAAADCPSIVPIKTINPTLGNWRQSLARALDDWGARLVRIVPNYHQYSMISQCVAGLAAALSERGVPLLVQMRIEDERNQYPLMQVPGVGVSQILHVASVWPRLRVVALGATRGEALTLASSHAGVHVDLSWIEQTGGIARLLAQVPAERVLFGSHSPFFYTRANLMKLEHARITPEQRRMIARDNAARLLGDNGAAS